MSFLFHTQLFSYQIPSKQTSNDFDVSDSEIANFQRKLKKKKANADISMRCSGQVLKI